VTPNKEIKKPEDMKGMKLRVPPAPLYLMLAKSVGANATTDRVCRSVSCAATGHCGRPGKSAADHHGQEVLRSAEPRHADGHIIESLLTIVGTHVWSKLSDADKKVFDEVLVQAAAKSSDQIRESEQKIADQLRQLGKTVVQVDREAFRKAAIPLHNDASAGAGWSQGEYDTLQALK